MSPIFSINKSATGQNSRDNITAPTMVIVDRADYLKTNKKDCEIHKNENEIEELDEIDRKVLFNSSL